MAKQKLLLYELCRKYGGLYCSDAMSRGIDAMSRVIDVMSRVIDAMSRGVGVSRRFTRIYD